MRSVKLKPVRLLKNEILVKPPTFLIKAKNYQKEKLVNCVLTTVADLKIHMRNRKVSEEKKQAKILENEEKLVENLSD